MIYASQHYNVYNWSKVWDQYNFFFKDTFIQQEGIQFI